MSVLVVTSSGDLVVDLYTDRCPLTCKNFLKLCKIKYYNGCLFHTVQKDFTAQTGDPTGTGTGGDSVYKFLYGDQARFFGDEIHLDIKHSKTGSVAMASAGENLNASQFYFTLRDDLDYLDGKHTVFGEVAEGLETLTRLNEAYVDEKGRPFKNIRIKHTYILDDPFSDPTQLAEFIPESSPEGRPKDELDDDVRLEDDWVPMDEQLGPAELEEVTRLKAAQSSAVVLEAIGDIPEAEIKPPENVLFVCKLNPVTEDEDLHTIFSRFGTVVSADIIRDYKTGDSLCYAFIEFETNEACEEAYFKMDSALIDDRRIHVDFSQSVSKLWSQFRHRNLKSSRGAGCFKCGALGHIAKDCPEGGTDGGPQAPTYVLKDDNVQHGGHDNSRYEMLFEDDKRERKRERDHEAEDQTGGTKMNRHGSAEEWVLSERHIFRGYRADEKSRGRYGREDRGYEEAERQRSGRGREHEHRDRGNREDRGYEEAERQQSGSGREHKHSDRGIREDGGYEEAERQQSGSGREHKHSDRGNREDGGYEEAERQRSGSGREHKHKHRDGGNRERPTQRDTDFRKRNENSDRRRDSHGVRDRRKDVDNGGSIKVSEPETEEMVGEKWRGEEKDHRRRENKDARDPDMRWRHGDRKR